MDQHSGIIQGEISYGRPLTPEEIRQITDYFNSAKGVKLYTPKSVDTGMPSTLEKKFRRRWVGGKWIDERI